jgi:hypothetical protein
VTDRVRQGLDLPQRGQELPVPDLEQPFELRPSPPVGLRRAGNAGDLDRGRDRTGHRTERIADRLDPAGKGSISALELELPGPASQRVAVNAPARMGRIEDRFQRRAPNDAVREDGVTTVGIPRAGRKGQAKIHGPYDGGHPTAESEQRGPPVRPAARRPSEGGVHPLSSSLGYTRIRTLETDSHSTAAARAMLFPGWRGEF